MTERKGKGVPRSKVTVCRIKTELKALTLQRKRRASGSESWPRSETVSEFVSGFDPDSHLDLDLDPDVDPEGSLDRYPDCGPECNPQFQLRSILPMCKNCCCSRP